MDLLVTVVSRACFVFVHCTQLKPRVPLALPATMPASCARVSDSHTSCLLDLSRFRKLHALTEAAMLASVRSNRACTRCGESKARGAGPPLSQRCFRHTFLRSAAMVTPACGIACYLPCALQAFVRSHLYRQHSMHNVLASQSSLDAARVAQASAAAASLFIVATAVADNGPNIKARLRGHRCNQRSAAVIALLGEQARGAHAKPAGTARRLGAHATLCQGLRRAARCQDR